MRDLSSIYELFVRYKDRVPDRACDAGVTAVSESKPFVLDCTASADSKPNAQNSPKRIP